MKKSTKTIIALLVLAALVIGAALVWHFNKPAAAPEGEKSVTVTVVHGDGSEKDFTLHTDLDTLGGALLEAKLIVGNDGQYGLYVTAVDGETADDSAEQWWCFADGEGTMLPTGIDMTPIADGDSFRAILETGYDAFG